MPVTRHRLRPQASDARSGLGPGCAASPAKSSDSVRLQRKLCHNARRWACLWSMLASDSPMVRVWKPKPTGKGMLTAPWNLRSRSLRPQQRDKIVFADALQNQEGERLGAPVGHEMRSRRPDDIDFAGLQIHFLFRILQEQPHLAVKNVESCANPPYEATTVAGGRITPFLPACAARLREGAARWPFAGRSARPRPPGAVRGRRGSAARRRARLPWQASDGDRQGICEGQRAVRRPWVSRLSRYRPNIPQPVDPVPAFDA